MRISRPGVVYLDDILIFSQMHVEHVAMVKKVLSWLMEYQ